MPKSRPPGTRPHVMASTVSAPFPAEDRIAPAEVLRCPYRALLDNPEWHAVAAGLPEPERGKVIRAGLGRIEAALAAGEHARALDLALHLGSLLHVEVQELPSATMPYLLVDRAPVARRGRRLGCASLHELAFELRRLMPPLPGAGVWRF
jgi:hypothetical protein